MATKLRLQRDDPPARTRGRTTRTPAPKALKFPAGAVATMDRHARAARLARAIERPEGLSHEQLVSDIAATLNHMQSHLDDLQQQVERYRFPDETGDRPRAA